MSGTRGVVDLFSGAGYLLRGLRWVAGRPKDWLFALIPALVTLAIYVAVLVAVVGYVPDLVVAATPFADGWADAPRLALRILAGILVVGAALLLAAVTFTAVTLAIGSPFYEKLAERVENDHGGAPPAHDEPVLRGVVRGVLEGATVLCYAVGAAVLLLLIGVIPVAGQVISGVLGAAVSGYLLTAELTGVALERRGVHLRARLAVLRANRALAVGFGTLTFLLFLVPLGAVFGMPAAVAGATLLVRERLTVPMGPPHGVPTGR